MKKVDGSYLKVSSVPAASGARCGDGGGAASVSFGRMMMGSCIGQESMNICARL